MLIYHYLHRMDKTLGRLGSDLFGLKATRLTTLVLAVLLVGLLITALNIWQLSTLQVNSFAFAFLKQRTSVLRSSSFFKGVPCPILTGS